MLRPVSRRDFPSLLWHVALLAGLTTLSACGSEPTAPAPASSAPLGPAAPQGPDVVQIKNTGMTWTTPSAFKQVPPSPMRLASYQVPKAEGDPDDGDLSVSQAKGTVAANIQRWEMQFTGADKAEVTEQTVGDLKVTVVWITGSYKGMGMPAAKSGYALLGAIVEWTGHDTFFFKLTGPKNTVEAARPGFNEMIASVKHN